MYSLIFTVLLAVLNPGPKEPTKELTLHGFYDLKWDTPRETVLKQTHAHLNQDGLAVIVVAQAPVTAFLFGFQDGKLIRAAKIVEIEGNLHEMAQACDKEVNQFMDVFGPPTRQAETQEEGLILEWKNKDTIVQSICSPENKTFELIFAKVGASDQLDKTPSALPNGVKEL